MLVAGLSLVSFKRLVVSATNQFPNHLAAEPHTATAVFMLILLLVQVPTGNYQGYYGHPIYEQHLVEMALKEDIGGRLQIC